MPENKNIAIIISVINIVGEINLAIQKCPMMSDSQGNYILCLQEECAWYMKNYKSCSIYVLAHDAAMNIRAKQVKAK